MDYEHEKQLDDAIKNNDLELFKRLIAEQPYNNKYRPLETACHYDRTEMVKILIEQGAFIHDDFNSLAYAARHGNLELMQFLYEHAENIGHAFNWASKGIALQDAAGSGNIEAVRFLLDRNADANYLENPTPLDAAAETRNLDILKLLVSYGADPTDRYCHAIRTTKKLIHKHRHERKLKSILTYLLNIKQDWPIYKAVFANDIAEINRILGSQPLSLSKDTKSWLKHGCTKTPGFEHAQHKYRLGIIKDRLERKMTRPVAKVRPNKI